MPPRLGQKSLTLKEEVYEIAKKRAEEEGSSIARWINATILEKKGALWRVRLAP